MKKLKSTIKVNRTKIVNFRASDDETKKIEALAAKWAATFRQSELLLFDRTRRARWLTEAQGLDHLVAVLAIGWRREPLQRRPTCEHHRHPQ